MAPATPLRRVRLWPLIGDAEAIVASAEALGDRLEVANMDGPDDDADDADGAYEL
jgi:hypothetical protein